MENNYKHTAKITSCIKKIPSLSFFLPKTGVASYTIYSPPPSLEPRPPSLPPRSGAHQVPPVSSSATRLKNKHSFLPVISAVAVT